MYLLTMFALLCGTLRLLAARPVDWPAAKYGSSAVNFRRLANASAGEPRRGGDSPEAALTELYKKFLARLAAGRRSGPAGIAVKSGRGSTAQPSTVRLTGRTTVSAAGPAARPTAFVDERECSAANGGRPCVCRTADLLERLTADGRSAVGCPSYSVVPAEIVFDGPAATTGVRETAAIGSGQGGGDLAAVDFDAVIDYRPARPSGDDCYTVQYEVVGKNVEVECSYNNDNSNYTSFAWNFDREKHETNTAVTGTESSRLLITNLQPEASKNYTCVPATGGVGHQTNGSSYIHDVIAIEVPVYEIRVRAFYKNKGRDCDPSTLEPFYTQLPTNLQTVVCPEGRGSSRHACNVHTEKPECNKEKTMLVVNHTITLNNESITLNRFKRHMSSLNYQKTMARLSKVLAENLKKALTMRIVSKVPMSDAVYEPEIEKMFSGSFVSCGPRFGVRRVFCAACPPHHYSPDRSSGCLKCPEGTYQPHAGSARCIKQPYKLAKRFAKGLARATDFFKEKRDLTLSVFLVFIAVGAFLLVVIFLPGLRFEWIGNCIGVAGRGRRKSLRLGNATKDHFGRKTKIKHSKVFEKLHQDIGVLVKADRDTWLAAKGHASQN